MCQTVAHLCDSGSCALLGRAREAAEPRLPDLALPVGDPPEVPDMAPAKNADSAASDARSDAAVVVTKLDTLLRMLASTSKNSSEPDVSCSACDGCENAFEAASVCTSKVFSARSLVRD